MSQRNNMVSRWRNDTVYKLEYFRFSDRQVLTETREVKGKRTEDYIRKRLKLDMPDGEMIVSIQVMGYKRRLYAMPEAEFYEKAKIIKEESDTI